MFKILIIEDDKLLQKALSEKFTKEDFEVVVASDGKEGIIVAAKEKPDFILLDLMMPVMSGDIALTHLKQLVETSKIPVAILTAVSDGIPQMNNPEVFDKAVGFWEKDNMSLEEIVANVKRYMAMNANIN